MTTAQAIAATETGPLSRHQVEGVRQAVRASRAKNTLRSYASGWRAWEAWSGANHCQAMPAGPMEVAAYLKHRAAQGAKVATVRAALAAIGAMHRFGGHPDPASHEIVRAAMKGLARQHAEPQRQAQGLTLEDAVRLVSTATMPRQRPGGKWETIGAANRRGKVDAAIVAVLFQGGLRRSEAAALTWGDIEAVEGGALIHVRTSKANQEGQETDVRFCKNGFARALLALRPTNARPEGSVFGNRNGQSIGRRFAAACKAAGLDGDYTGHSGRVGLAQELTRRGASTTETQLAGGWKTARMVARYSAGVAAEQGAVAKYL